MFATSVTSGWNALSAPLLFVSVGVSVGLEEPLRWRGVNTHARSQTVREALTQTGGETDRSDRHRPGLGLGGTPDPSSAEKVRARA